MAVSLRSTRSAVDKTDAPVGGVEYDSTTALELMANGEGQPLPLHQSRTAKMAANALQGLRQRFPRGCARAGCSRGGYSDKPGIRRCHSSPFQMPKTPTAPPTGRHDYDERGAEAR